MKHHTLSRTAERTYWLARYLERAESTARLVNVTGNVLIDLPRRLPFAWRPLVDIVGSSALFAELYDDANERNVVRFLVADARNPSSITRSLDAARANARTIREIMPRVAFEYVNQLCLYAHQELGHVAGSRARRIEVMDGIVARAQQFDGFLAGAMLRDHNWSFYEAGRHLERADMTTRIIEMRALSPIEPDAGLEPFELVQWRSILRSLHSMQNYRIFMQEPVRQPLVLEFLFKNPDLPRSVAFCLETIRRVLKRLPRHERPLRAVNRIVRTLRAAAVDELEGEPLVTFIAECQRALAELHDEISATYFYGRARRSPHTGRRSQRSGALHKALAN